MSFSRETELQNQPFGTKTEITKFSKVSLPAGLVGPEEGSQTE